VAAFAAYLAIVALAPDASLDAASIQNALAKKLAKFKLPKQVIFTHDLPRNAIGKVQKRLLREQFGNAFFGHEVN
jgi:malonyl-CoA/methylmalonyl-CoA synthetase